MIKRLKIFILLIACTVQYAIGQDMHFSQFYASSVFLNPAFTGAGVCSRLSLNYRNQWPGVTEGYSSTLLSFDHYIKRNNLGLGMLLGRDVSGSGDMSRTIVYPLMAYEARINRKLGLRFGFQPGFGINSINYDRLVFGDQIARGGNVPTIEQAPNSASYFDVGAGILAYAIKFWFGISFNHLNSPIESFYSYGEAKLPIKYSAHGGYKFDLEEGVKSISLAFNYRGQQKFDQLDIGGYFTKDVFNIGLWYRGLPFIKSYEPGYSNNDAISIILGVKTDKMNIGYSYDYTISKLSNSNSHGAHEISLSYQFCSLSKQKGRRIIVECPSF